MKKFSGNCVRLAWGNAGRVQKNVSGEGGVFRGGYFLTTTSRSDVDRGTTGDKDGDFKPGACV